MLQRESLSIWEVSLLNQEGYKDKGQKVPINLSTVLQNRKTNSYWRVNTLYKYKSRRLSSETCTKEILCWMLVTLQNDSHQL